MTDYEFKALVVDDERAVRDLTVRALSREAIECDTAADGGEGLKKVHRGHYDLVVTDLRMPGMHGHALATDILGREDRPLLVVLTGVLEPRLAKDLIARGVDELTFKPVDYALFATKIRALLNRRRGSGSESAAESTYSDRLGAAAGTADDGGQPAPVSADELASKLSNVAKILPISQAALDVFQMAGSDNVDASQLAAAIGRDASLVTDVLQLANCTLYNPSGQRVIELEEAVARIGQRRVREIALATSALTSVTAGILPWMDVGLAWRRSVAAGVAAELLIAEGDHRNIDEGVVLSAIMHPLGRIVLGTLFPKKYEAMVRFCRQHGEPLQYQEKQVFSESHANIMARLLSTWNIPPDVYLPLGHLLSSYEDTARLGEPLRTQVLLVKIAILVGQVTVGPWESWDLVEFPPDSLLPQLDIRSLPTIVEQTAADLEGILTFRGQPLLSGGLMRRTPRQKPATCQVLYCQLGETTFDCLAALLPSMGITRIPSTADVCALARNALLNCTGVPPSRFSQYVTAEMLADVTIVCDAKHQPMYGRRGTAVAVPCSYQALRTAIRGSRTDTAYEEASAH